MKNAPISRTLQNILHAAAKEQNSILFYERLADMSPDSQSKNIISNRIQTGEKQHLQNLITLHSQLTGKPTVLPNPQMPDFNKYQDGLNRVILDELDSHKFYKASYLQTTSPKARQVFFDLLHDELEHAAYANFLMTRKIY